MSSAARKSSSKLREPAKVRETARLAIRAGLRDAAERVFVRGGFSATKMSDIAREAGVAVGTLYNYFESKEVIFEEILASRGTEFLARLEPTLQIRSPLERLSAIVRNGLEFIDDHSALFAIFVERGGVAEYDLQRLGGDLTEREYACFLGQLGDCLRAAVQARELRRDIAVPTMVAALSGAMNGATYAWLKRKRRGRLSAVADDLVTLFLAGARVR
jgi:AcrR family transcriptional regulator